eukprot:Gb_36639 [translate_table: standard]
MVSEQAFLLCLLIALGMAVGLVATKVCPNCHDRILSNEFNCLMYGEEAVQGSVPALLSHLLHGINHEFADLTWYPSQGKVIYKDPRVKGNLFHQTTVVIGMSKIKDFIKDMKNLQDMDPYQLCEVDIQNGMLMRFNKASSAYLGKMKDSIEIDIAYSLVVFLATLEAIHLDYQAIFIYSIAVSYVGNNIDGGMRYQMPGAFASWCLQVPIERWCLSIYNSSQMSQNAQGLFPMDYWFCNICGVQPARGFEYSMDVLPRFFKIKYDSGLLAEFLCLDTAKESYMISPRKCVLEFPHAVHESIFPELRVVRYGKLRGTFNSSLKILYWELCAKVHDEVVPWRNLLQQAQQLSDAEQEGFDKDAGNLRV